MIVMMANNNLLTDKKRKWSHNRDVVLRGYKLSYNASQQEKYERSLSVLVIAMVNETRKEVFKLFRSPLSKDYFKKQESIAMDASLSSQARILMNALTLKFSQLFDSRSGALAKTMVIGASKTSKSTLHRSLSQLSGGLSLNTGIVSEGMEDVAKASIEENVSLIRSIPEQYFKDVTGSVMRSITTGRGIQDLIPDIEKYEGQTKRRARNIALDQTRKAYNSINKQKMVALGITKFEWLHSGGGQSPRDSHQKISGHIFSFENLYEEQAALGVPEKDRGLPSVPVNCMCTILPVIDLSGE